MSIYILQVIYKYQPRQDSNECIEAFANTPGVSGVQYLMILFSRIDNTCRWHQHKNDLMPPDDSFVNLLLSSEQYISKNPFVHVVDDLMAAFAK